MLLAIINLDPAVLTSLLVILGIASNAVSVYVALYVKARVAPIVERQLVHQQSIRDLENGQQRIWTKMDVQGQDQANLRGQCQGCKVLEVVLTRLAELVTHNRKTGG
jgi:hypothetical protein